MREKARWSGCGLAGRSVEYRHYEAPGDPPTLPVVPNAGVKNADEKELQEIASEPDSTHVYNVAEFDLMHTVVESLTRTVCSRVEEQDREIKGTRASARRASLGAENGLWSLHPGFPAALCASTLRIGRVDRGHTGRGAAGLGGGGEVRGGGGYLNHWIVVSMLLHVGHHASLFLIRCWTLR